MIAPRVLASLALCLMAGCATHQVRESPAPPVLMPHAFSHDGTVPATDRWWETFGDVQLNLLVETAMAGNLNLAQAWARIDQAEAVVRRSQAGLFPTLNAGGDARRGRVSASTPLGTQSSTQNQFGLSMSAFYEVDLWGRVGSLTRSSELAARASREDLEATAMLLAGNVVQTWFVMVEQRARLALLEEQIETGKRNLDLIVFRQGQGLASALDVDQQRRQLSSVQAQAPLARARLDTAVNTLSVLLGLPPGEPLGEELARLPDLPPLPRVGLPAQLLTRRPDLRAAQLRVAAADHALAAAIADRFPALTLSGATGGQAAELRDVLDNWIWNLAAGLTAPLLDGGRRAAEVDRQQAVVRERLFAYGETTLRAMLEVEDALVRERHQTDYLRALEAQLAHARQEYNSAVERFRNGLVSYLPVLGALQSLQQVERELLAARRELLAVRVDLYRALGGDWTTELPMPLPPTVATQGVTP